MRTILFLTLAGTLAGISGSAATMKGWISDASCGAANANAKPESRECAARCLKSGAAPVFVSDGDQKVYKIAGNSKVADHLSHKVQVTGDVQGDTLTIKEIKSSD